MIRPGRVAGLAAACGLLHGCATPPPVDVPPAPQDPPPVQFVVLPPEPTAYEIKQRGAALQLAAQGRLAEAALVWEVLMTIRPSVPEYRNRWDELQRRIDAAVAEKLHRAQQAKARGQLDAAAQQYLSALALEPTNARAADALRGIERERNKRNHLGKLSRHTLTRRAMSDAETPVDAAAPAEGSRTAPRR